jgi:signal transduction histidine kinase
LVATHDAERHRLERNLHDGAQQQVVAIKVKLGIAQTLSEREDAGDVTAIVAALADDTQDAVDAMRAVAHGIYPPLLEAEGLEVALTATLRSVQIPVDLQIDGIERYERSTEESLYFCSLEAVTRALESGATRAAIRLFATAESVSFTISHDGAADDLLEVRDRLEAFGGRLDVDVDAADCIVTGQLPITDSVAVTV